MKRLTNFFFLILLFSVSCKETNNGIQEDKTVSKDIRYNEVTFDLIHKIKYYEAVEKWINYSELSEFIVQINSADYSSLIDNKKFLLRFFKGIKYSTPNELNKSEIISRLTVIETDFLIFEAMLSNYEIENDEKIKMVKKINNSFSNLNFQIDKLLEKQSIIAD